MYLLQLGCYCIKQTELGKSLSKTDLLDEIQDLYRTVIESIEPFVWGANKLRGSGKKSYGLLVVTLTISDNT